jgi:AcrR family transcriptional regulator
MEVEMSTESKILEKSFIDWFKKEIPDKRVRKILLNSLNIFARKGFSATKVKEIATKAGFSEGFLYNYFRSKDGIYTKLVELAVQGSAASVRFASKLNGSPYQKIKWLTEALLSYDSIAMKHWRMIIIQASTSDAIPNKAKKIFRNNIEKPLEHIVPIIKEGQKCGEIINEDANILAITYSSFIQGLSITKIQNRKDDIFPSVEMILKFLKNK